MNTNIQDKKHWQSYVATFLRKQWYKITLIEIALYTFFMAAYMFYSNI